MSLFDILSGNNSREITCVCKDSDGDIIAIGGKGGWKHSKEEAIRNIKRKICKYYVNVRGQQVQIHVVEENRDMLGLLNPIKYLRTNRDNTQVNNLGDLPECPNC